MCEFVDSRVYVDNDLPYALEVLSLTDLSERDQEIFKKRHLDKSVTYEILGQEYGVSRERIRQINVSACRRVRWTMERLKTCEECRSRFTERDIEKIREESNDALWWHMLFEYMGGMSIEEIAEKHRCCRKKKSRAIEKIYNCADFVLKSSCDEK